MTTITTPAKKINIGPQVRRSINPFSTVTDVEYSALFPSISKATIFI